MAGDFLTNQFLVAMPGMSDPRFDRSVIYLCAHSEQGAMGIIINKTTPMMSFGELFAQIERDGEEVPMAEALENGHLVVDLHGHKLTGAFALTTTKRGWLLVKKDDAGADRHHQPATTQLESVLSGRTNDDLAGT